MARPDLARPEGGTFTGRVGFTRFFLFTPRETIDLPEEGFDMSLSH
jgi:hypothetical protein